MSPTREVNRQVVRLAKMALNEVGLDGRDLYATDRQVHYGGGNASRKAGRLAIWHELGPDQPVVCDRHVSVLAECDRIPVSWALLGHTCGRAS